MEDKVNILLVDDQPDKLLSTEVILEELGEHIIKASSANEALSVLLKHDIAVILVDVVMPDLDGFQLAATIREHPRFQKISIIFISAIQFADADHLRGYELGAVDYVPVPVIAQVLRAKVKVFVELHRKTRQLERLNEELERRVAERTAALEASNEQLRQSERRRSLALSAGNMGSWDLDLATGRYTWDEGQYSIFGLERGDDALTIERVRSLVHPEDRAQLPTAETAKNTAEGYQHEFRVVRPNGELRWCFGAMVPTLDDRGQPIRLSGVTFDITERKQAEEHQILLAREVDHRAKNAITVIQSFLYLTRARTIDEFVRSIEGRIKALAATHNLLSATRWQGADLSKIVADELAPYNSASSTRTSTEGSSVYLRPAAAQTVALALHELATNAAKYGALSTAGGHLQLTWEVSAEHLSIRWLETGGPPAKEPQTFGFGMKMVKASIEAQLAGSVIMDWRREGLACRLVIPSSALLEVEATDESETAPSKAISVRSEKNLKGRRILVAEDEIVISMLLKDTLAGFGVEVIGPVNNLADGLDAVGQERLDGAVLDLNLGGNLIYPIAELLSGRGVPFVFLTGYDRTVVDTRFTTVPVLQKPIQPEALQDILLTGLAREAA